MRIYTNTTAMTAYRSLTKTNDSVSKSMERLSTGLRINSAADDATGLVISEQMGNQIKGFNQAIKNSQQGMSMLRTAEGAMGQQSELLSRIRELVVSSNAGSMTSENKDSIQSEITELMGQFDDIANDTQFNGKTLLNGTLGEKLEIEDAAGGSTLLSKQGISNAEITGSAGAGTYTVAFDDSVAGSEFVSMTFDDGNGGITTQQIEIATADDAAYTGTLNFDKFGITFNVNTADAGEIAGDLVVATQSGSLTFQVGANNGQALDVTIDSMLSTAVGDTVGGTMLSEVDVSDTGESFANNLAAVDGAIAAVSTARAKLGANINRFEASINNLNVSKENLEASQSLIKDLDMADEMMQMTRNQVLSQASTAMLAQANQQPQNILQLLR